MPSTDGTEGPDGDIENPNDATGTCLFDAFLTGTLSWCRDGQSIPPGFCDVIHSDGMVVARQGHEVQSTKEIERPSCRPGLRHVCNRAGAFRSIRSDGCRRGAKHGRTAHPPSRCSGAAEKPAAVGKAPEPDQ